VSERSPGVEAGPALVRAAPGSRPGSEVSEETGKGYDLGPEQETRPLAPAPAFSTEPPVRELPDRPGSAKAPRRDRDAWRSDAPRKKKPAANNPGRDTVEPVGRGGIFPLPKHPEETVLGSLRYPLWDALGIACLLLLAPVMAAISLIVFAALPLVFKGGQMLLLGPITFPFLIVFTVALGFVFEVCEAVLVASAHAEIHHPPWPEFALGGVFHALLRWAVAWGPPLLLVWFLTRSLIEPLGGTLLGRMILGGIYATSGIVALVSLLATTLHDDLWAASPFMVLPAVARLGSRLLGPLGLLIATVVLTVAGYAFLRFIGEKLGIVPLMAATWVAWMGLLYAGMVVMRATGWAYQQRAKRIGWFYREPKREEVVTEPPPPVEALATRDSTEAPRPSAEPIPVEDDGLGDW
jgi:hypothetical protein